MRTTYLAAAIAAALAPMLAPAVTTMSASTAPTSASSSARVTPAASNALTAPAATASTSGTSSTPTTSSSGSSTNPFLGSPMQLQNVGNADSRAATTNQVTQPSRSSGLSSENVEGTGVTSNTTSGGTGIASGNLTAAQATGQEGEAVGAGIPVGSTTGNEPTGGTGTGNETGNTTGFVNPVITGSLGATAEGDQLLFDANGNAIGTSGTLGMANTVNTGPAPVNNGVAAADLVYADRAMNQVIHDARAERHRIGRNGQLLYSITPRTDVDRSKEVPDDGPLAFQTPIR